MQTHAHHRPGTPTGDRLGPPCRPREPRCAAHRALAIANEEARRRPARRRRRARRLASQPGAPAPRRARLISLRAPVRMHEARKRSLECGAEAPEERTVSTTPQRLRASPGRCRARRASARNRRNTAPNPPETKAPPCRQRAAKAKPEKRKRESFALVASDLRRLDAPAQHDEGRRPAGAQVRAGARRPCGARGPRPCGNDRSARCAAAVEAHRREG